MFDIFTHEQWEDNLVRIRCTPMPWRGDIAVYFMLRQSRDGRMINTVARITEAEDAPEGLLPPNPTVHLPDRVAQELMNELWLAGVRPSEGAPSSAGMDAQGKHLEDMRAVAFGKLGIAAPAKGK